MHAEMSAASPPAQASPPAFFCPRCRCPHPWAAEHAGRTARCGCGNVLKVPAALPGFMPAGASPRAMPIVDEPGPVAPFLRMSSADAGEELSPDVEAEMAALGRYAEDEPNTADPRRDLHVPVALLAIGFAIAVVDFGYTMRPGAAVAAAVLVTGFKLLFGMVMMLAAALLAARFAGINFGPVGPALLKLAGLCLAPSALGDLVTSLLGGDMAVAQLGWIVRIVLYWVLVSYLFRLDGAQTAAVVAAVTIVKIVTTVVIGSLLMIAVAPGLASDPLPVDEKDDVSVLLDSAGDDLDEESDGE